MPSTYAEQLRFIFDRPLTQPAWYDTARPEEEDPFAEGPLAAFEYIERLCLQPKTDLAPYSDEQIAQGLDFIFNNCFSNLSIDFKEAPVPPARREQALRKLFVLFRDVFQPRCLPEPSAGSAQRVSALNSVCYMFWDVCPLSTWLSFDNTQELSLSFLGDVLDTDIGANLPEEVKAMLRQQIAGLGDRKKSAEEIVGDVRQQYANLDANTKACYQAIAYVMEQCLALDNPACVESGLHGLGHMMPFLPELAGPKIDRYLQRKPKGHPALLRYAQAARSGMIQ
ncbi:MAG: hypothetical protein IT260_13940 [Saprospiraceae bacterium]|nr:hypothetical protein [Saprospiraceae bacterium]